MTFEDYWETTGPWPNNILGTAFKEVAEKAFNAASIESVENEGIFKVWRRRCLEAEDALDQAEKEVKATHEAHSAQVRMLRERSNRISELESELEKYKYALSKANIRAVRAVVEGWSETRIMDEITKG